MAIHRQMTRNLVLPELKLNVTQQLYAVGLGLLLSSGVISGGSSESGSEDDIAIGAVVTDHEACSRVGRYSGYLHCKML